ncbi:DUF6476 family protein [Salipiger mangrovisoli]|uniref:Uncharacterized protein n=1 Tax=Salipiger mangrovisoli TaxID=2865933 RepID=A0ABR9WZ29_9RHOB|nr:DUF6476 family protein [Salipiger mangrovisoli]MBE9636538.1 hypothetical protein [Salipiger mangrovisoli]
MSNTPEDPELLPEPANLRFLRRLVTVLTAVMIAGLVAIVSLIVIRFTAATRAPVPLPSEITLPAGATASAFTQGGDWYAVVTTDNRILIYDRKTQQLRQTIAIAPAD